MNIENIEVIEAVKQLIMEKQAIEEELKEYRYRNKEAIKWINQNDQVAARCVLEHGYPF